MSRTVLLYIWGESGDLRAGGMSADKRVEKNEERHLMVASCARRRHELQLHKKKLLALKTNTLI